VCHPTRGAKVRFLAGLGWAFQACGGPSEPGGPSKPGCGPSKPGRGPSEPGRAAWFWAFRASLWSFRVMILAWRSVTKTPSRSFGWLTSTIPHLVLSPPLSTDETAPWLRIKTGKRITCLAFQNPVVPTYNSTNFIPMFVELWGVLLKAPQMLS